MSLDKTKYITRICYVYAIYLKKYNQYHLRTN